MRRCGDAARVAGLAVRLDSSGDLPEEMLVAADRLSLPVVVFPNDEALAGRPISNRTEQAAGLVEL
jgi:hypothetical protein